MTTNVKSTNIQKMWGKKQYLYIYCDCNFKQG